MGEFTYDFGFRPKEYIAESMLGLIGKTPLVNMSRFASAIGSLGTILGKLESFNPMGSSKDRISIAMIEAAMENGSLSEGGTVIEPTSGNTGIGIAFVCAVKGLKAIIVMPENMSEERKKLLKALGAQLELTQASKGMLGAIERANELKEQTGGVILNQFSNEVNPRTHSVTTAQEILHDTYGRVDYFVAGVGTGGTITGVGKTLKAFNPSVKIIAAEPFDSPLLNGGEAHAHKIEGIGANFIPEILDRDIIDEVIDVKTQSAYAAVKTAASTEGMLVGISSGAALFAASVVAQRAQARDKNIVVLLPDSAERYLSTELFAD